MLHATQLIGFGAGGGIVRSGPVLTYESAWTTDGGTSFTSVPLGSPEPGRRILVIAFHTGPLFNDITGVTLNGVSMPAVGTETQVSDYRAMRFFEIAEENSSTATIAVTTSAGAVTAARIYVYKLVNATGGGNFVNSTSVGSASLSMNLVVPQDGWGFCAAIWRNQTNVTWSGTGVTEINEDAVTNSVFSLATVTGTSGTIAVGASSGSDYCGIMSASWGP